MRLTRRGRIVVGALVAVALWVLLAGAATIGQNLKAERLSESESQPCLEDEACWDCEVMGNGICG
jgi:hypothetical protein